MLYFEQTSNFDCGKACVKMVLSYFDRNFKNIDKIILNGKMPVRFLCYLINQSGLLTKPFYSYNLVLPKKDCFVLLIKCKSSYHYVVLLLDSFANMIVYDPNPKVGVHNIDEIYLKKNWSGYAVCVENA